MTPFGALFTVILRSLATRGRLLGLGALALVGVILGAFVHTAASVDQAQRAYDIVDGYGLSLLIPVVALVFASAALGDPAEDGSLVYLWLRPVPRWQLALAAWGAAIAVAVPVAVLPLVLAAALTGVGARMVEAAAAGGLLATAAYAALFCGLGLRVRRALAWGLAYLLIWEQAVARVSHGAARASLFVAARSVAAHIAHRTPPTQAVSLVVGIVFPLVAGAVALVLTTRSLDRGEVT